MTRPTWKDTPPLFYYQGKQVPYWPFVVRCGAQNHLLALHKDGNWLLSNPETGHLVLEVSSYAYRRPGPSGNLNLKKARLYARKDVLKLMLALGPTAFNLALAGKLAA